jgi:hypothetical protein
MKNCAYSLMIKLLLPDKLSLLPQLMRCIQIIASYTAATGNQNLNTNKLQEFLSSRQIAQIYPISVTD